MISHLEIPDIKVLLEIILILLITLEIVKIKEKMISHLEIPDIKELLEVVLML